MKHSGFVRAELLVLLLRLLESNPQHGYHTHALAERFEVSEDTMLRDLHALSRSGLLPLRQVRRRWYVLPYPQRVVNQ